MMQTNDLAILILAAGRSSRLGRPKQLLVHANETLLRHAVQQALHVSSNVFVVLGHEKEACLTALEGLHVKCIDNENYLKGIGNSLSFGIAHTKAFSHTMIMLCDQPFIPTTHYASLALHVNDHHEIIIASKYENEPKCTVPAIFPKKYYDALLKLDGDKGAQFLLNSEPCLDVFLPRALAIDIDTKEDVENYLKS
jgi:molybdenum cofactor cytidylyltransferase